MPIQPTRLQPLGRIESGFRLQITAEAGLKLEVQATSDFKTWEPVAAITTGTSPADIEDTAGIGETQRFYRTVQRE